MTRALPSQLLRTPLLLAAACALANGLWSLFLWQQLLVARRGGEAFCAFGGGCGALWDGAFASRVHDWTGLPVAAWGVVWSGAALALALFAWRRLRGAGEPEPAWTGLVCVAGAGALSVAGLVAVSAAEGSFCSNCAITYALVAAFAGVVLATAWVARPRRLAGGATAALACVAGLFLLLLVPGLQTPRAGAHLGAGTLEAPRATGKGPIAELEGLLAYMPPEERQRLANALAHFEAAEPVAAPASRALIGAPMAPIRITTFTDSGCSHCAHFHEGLDRALGSLPPRTVAIDQRVFPLDHSCNEHVQGVGREELCLAARVRVCLEQDPRAWELTGWLHRDARPLAEDTILRVAERLAPRSQVESCVSSEAADRKLREDIAFAMAAGIMGTPFVLVNGKPSSTYLPFLYALVLTAGDATHPVFASLPPPRADEPGHEGHGH
ncbi:MAG: cupin [Myxococcota bacterium]